MLEIRCTHTNGAHECGRFLAKLEGGYIVIRCPLCKTEQRIGLADLVLQHANEAREMERVMSERDRLLW